MINLETKIQWTDFTINLWEGCFKVDDECKYCYMYRDFAKYGKDARVIRQVSIKTVNKKLKAARELLERRKAEGDNTPVKLFLSSWTDVFLKEADHLRHILFQIIRDNPDFIFQLLTKRPELITERLPDDWGDGWKNVWMGTSVGQNKGTQRIDDLLKVKAQVRFLSAEPLIGNLNIRDWLYPKDSNLSQDLHWVIIGGESGNDIGKYKYRECRVEWIEDLISQCKIAGVPVFVKQLGTHLSKHLKLKDRHAGNIEEWPDQLRIREMPIT